MRIGVLSVQGAFAEHERAFADVGAETFEIRQLRDIEQPFDAIVLPGGESTVQGKLLNDLGLFKPLKERIEYGLPVFATCAGLILLAENIADDPTKWFGILPVTVRRNAYGRQLGSFAATGSCGALANVPMTFIRAPSIVYTRPDVEILSSHDGHPTAVRWRNIWGFAGHPELTDDRRIFEAFCRSIPKT